MITNEDKLFKAIAIINSSSAKTSIEVTQLIIDYFEKPFSYLNMSDGRGLNLFKEEVERYCSAEPTEINKRGLGLALMVRAGAPIDKLDADRCKQYKRLIREILHNFHNFLRFSFERVRLLEVSNLVKVCEQSYPDLIDLAKDLQNEFEKKLNPSRFKSRSESGLLSSLMAPVSSFGSSMYHFFVAQSVPQVQRRVFPDPIPRINMNRLTKDILRIWQEQKNLTAVSVLINEYLQQPDADLNQDWSQEGGTLLYWMIAYNHREIVNLLLMDYKVDVNARNKLSAQMDMSMLNLAQPMLLLLLDKGANLPGKPQRLTPAFENFQAQPIEVNQQSIVDLCSISKDKIINK